MNIYELLKQAILNKQQVFATYDGYHREMCPHILGFKKGENGENIRQCLFYQFAGQSSKGPIIPNSEHNWRCFAVEKLTNVSVRVGIWHTSPKRTFRKQTCIDLIDIEIKF